MKPYQIVLAVFFGVVFAAVLAFLIVDLAQGQTPSPYPDIPLEREGATYTFNIQPVEPIDKMIQLCCTRVDLVEPIELGCVAHTTLDLAPITVSVDRTPHQDAEIRCYAEDSEGNVSDLSSNAAWADFTPPGKPHVK
jgi:hypothetical protein